MSSLLISNTSNVNEDAKADSTTTMKDNNDRLYQTFHCCFTKVVLVEGSGFSKPLLESTCEVGLSESEYNSVNEHESANVLSDNLGDRKSITIGMSEDTRSLGLETMLMTMKRGETSRFRIKWKPGLGKSSQILLLHSAEEGIHNFEQGQCIIILLHDFTEVTPVWQMNSEQKYELCLQHKDYGTSFYKQEKVESAFYQYSVALKYIISVTTFEELDESQKEKYKQLKCICYLNLAACQIKSENFQNVVDNCSQCLTLDPWNAKGLYRRATAYKHLGKLDEARSDLVKIMKKEPRNKAAADLLESLMPSNVENDQKDTS